MSRVIFFNGASYRNIRVFETLCERRLYCVFVLLLDNPWRSRKDAEGAFSLACVGRLAGLEERTKQFGPLFSWEKIN
jgi:hypothetical protein